MFIKISRLIGCQFLLEARPLVHWSLKILDRVSHLWWARKCTPCMTQECLLLLYRSLYPGMRKYQSMKMFLLKKRPRLIEDNLCYRVSSQNKILSDLNPNNKYKIQSFSKKDSLNFKSNLSSENLQETLWIFRYSRTSLSKSLIRSFEIWRDSSSLKICEKKLKWSKADRLFLQIKLQGEFSLTFRRRK